MYVGLIVKQLHDSKNILAMTNHDVENRFDAMDFFDEQFVGFEIIDYFEGSTYEYVFHLAHNSVKISNKLEIDIPIEYVNNIVDGSVEVELYCEDRGRE